MRKVPLVGQDLLDYLNESFPESGILAKLVGCSADRALAAISELRGERRVIGHLESLVSAQTKRATSSSLIM